MIRYSDCELSYFYNMEVKLQWAIQVVGKLLESDAFRYLSNNSIYVHQTLIL